MGSAQTNNVVQFGGGRNTTAPTLVLPYSSLGNLIQLSCFVNTSTADNYLMLSHWASTGSSGQYQVTSGKTFIATGVWYYTNSSAQKIALGYGTAALGSDNTATPPAGAKYFSSGATVPSFFSDSGAVWAFLPLSLQFPSLAFPFVKVFSSSDNFNILLLGVEQ